MTTRDPLRVLHADDPPVQPDPAFTAALRARLESALSLPAGSEEIVMSGTADVLAELDQPQPMQEQPRPAALPYLTVGDARAAIAWYRDAFGAVVVGAPIVMEDDRIGHAELAVGGGVLYLADEYPEMGLRAPAAGLTSVSLMLSVADTDIALTRARRAGAEVEREPYEGHGSRTATIRDPFGHRWMLTGPVPEPIRHGDIGFVSVGSPDAARAVAFYARVLGWAYDPGAEMVTNTIEPLSVSNSERSTLVCCYAVDDLAAARSAIAAEGGQVGQSRDVGFGTVLAATDPSGTSFAVFEPAPGRRRPRLNGAGPGELSYVTYQVPDSVAFREFYGRLLGWTFEAGRIQDGWEVQGTQPMAGVAGGSAVPVVVPMWTVSDIDVAVERVREAGGTVLSEPVRQHYGLMAECADDQGGRFYLGSDF